MNSFIPWHSLTIRQVLGKLHTSQKGLLEQEAKRRLKRFGLNRILAPAAPPPFWRVALRSFATPANAFLAAGVAASIIFDRIAFAFVLSVLIVANGITFTALRERLSVVEQFVRSIAHSLSLVKRLPTPRSSPLPQLKPADEVVPGDILFLFRGDRVPADGRILSAINFQVDESTITGESFDQKKEHSVLAASTSLLERSNMVFSTSTVTQGNAIVAVTSTGKQTVVGAIGLEESRQRRPHSPMEATMLYRVLLVGTLGFFAITMAFLLNNTIRREQLSFLFLSALIAGLPQWMFSAVLLGSWETVRRLARIGVIVKSPDTAQTLGKLTTLCIDKTATLTEGALSIDIVVDGARRQYRFNKEIKTMTNRHDINALLAALASCNDASLIQSKGSKTLRCVGDGTDCALLKSLISIGMDRALVERKFHRVNSFPFSTERKWMATVHRSAAAGGLAVVHVKGAPERVLPLCKFHYQGATRRLLSSPDRDAIIANVETLSKAGYRLLAVASSSRRGSAPETCDDIRTLTWLGLVALSDPVRTDSGIFLSSFTRVGIRTIILTGDHQENALAVCRKLHFPVERVITGSAINAMDDRELEKAAARISVFARIEPKQKQRVIQALQRNGEIVGMTGDGVNDAFALKGANVGIAVSRSTDVARDSADVVVTADNLFSIHSAILEGKRLVASFHFLGLFLLSAYFNTIALLLYGVLAGFGALLLPWHLLWSSVVIHGIAAFVSMSMALVEPQRGSRKMFSRTLALFAAFSGLLMAGLAIAAQWWLPLPTIETFRAFFWTTLTIAPLGLFISVSSLTRSSLSRRVAMAGAFAGLAMLQLLAISDGWLKRLFQTEPLSMFAWLFVAAGFALAMILRLFIEQRERREYAA